jgi:hypothetical protein
MKCRFCGCREHSPCIDHWGNRCAWLTDELCTFCAEERLPGPIVQFIVWAVVARAAANALPHYSSAEHARAAERYREACEPVRLVALAASA